MQSFVELDDVARLADAIADAAREFTGARYAALAILNSDGDALERLVTAGDDALDRLEIGEMPHGRGVFGELLWGRRDPLRLRDVSTRISTDSIARRASSGLPGASLSPGRRSLDLRSCSSSRASVRRLNSATFASTGKGGVRRWCAAVPGCERAARPHRVLTRLASLPGAADARGGHSILAVSKSRPPTNPAAVHAGPGAGYWVVTGTTLEPMSVASR
jgi:hypothetical protein